MRHGDVTVVARHISRFCWLSGIEREAIFGAVVQPGTGRFGRRTICEDHLRGDQMSSLVSPCRQKNWRRRKRCWRASGVRGTTSQTSASCERYIEKQHSAVRAARDRADDLRVTGSSRTWQEQMEWRCGHADRRVRRHHAGDRRYPLRDRVFGVHRRGIGVSCCRRCAFILEEAPAPLDDSRQVFRRLGPVFPGVGRRLRVRGRRVRPCRDLACSVEHDRMYTRSMSTVSRNRPAENAILMTEDLLAKIQREMQTSACESCVAPWTSTIAWQQPERSTSPCSRRRRRRGCRLIAYTQPARTDRSPRRPG